MTIWKLVAATAALTLVPSCGDPSSSAPAGQSCPEGWQAGVLWSTENGAESEVTFVADGAPIARRTMPYAGFVPVPGSLEDRSGTDVVMVSNGDGSRDKTHLVTFSLVDCATASRRLPEQLVLGVAADRGASYTTHAFVDKGANVRRRDAAGRLTAEKQFPNLVLGKLLVHGGALYAIGANPHDPKRPTQLLVLDATTLAEKRRIVLRGSQGAVDGAAIKNGKLYYPQTLSEEREGHRLGIVDLQSFQHSSVELNTPAPSLVVDAGEFVWIGHTYLNSSFRSLADYRWVSRYHPASGKVERFDVGIGVSGLAVKDRTLYVLGTTGDENRAKLRIIDLPGMKLRTEVDIAKPDRPGHFYPSTIIVPS
jgi:hypothetical protein